MASIESHRPTGTTETQIGQPRMDLLQIIRAYLLQSGLARRDKWTRTQLSWYQEVSLKKMRLYAYAHSPFFRRFHRGLYDAPLNKLPVLTKKELMNNWDEVVTDRTVKLKEVMEFMGRAGRKGRFRGKYYINSTGGTTGLRGIFIHNPNEWLQVVGSYSRSLSLAGIRLGLRRPPRHVMVATTYPWHQETAVVSSTRSRFITHLMIDYTDSLDVIVDKLNAFQPDALSIYPDTARHLAVEQAEGRLKISPKKVFTSAEVLTKDVRTAISKTWGGVPFDQYGSTETGIFASECAQHRGLHINGDLIIPEFVDEQNQPVEPGRFSARVLVTVLFSRTIPLIRYELGDSVRLAAERCPCGRPFPLIDSVQGRVEDVIYLVGTSGNQVAIQPNFFELIMESIPSEGWQILQTGSSSLRISILHPDQDLDRQGLLQTISTGLAKQGALETSIELAYPTSLQRSSLGKTPLIKAMAPSIPPPSASP